MAALSDPIGVGEVARLCGVSVTTVHVWFNTRQLTGYRLPGRRKNSTYRHRRITRREVLDFLVKNEMPVPEELQIDAGV